jgi:uncharacterized protein (TIGR02145 family)
MNLDVKTDASWCYEDANANCAHYGRLYTWESAIKACHALGEGWRLPTDADWQELSSRHGDRAASFIALLAGGPSGFSAVLGGNRDLDGHYARLEAHGFYWTASEDAPATAIYYNFARGSKALFRQTGGEKQRAFSVRCIRG